MLMTRLLPKHLLEVYIFHVWLVVDYLFVLYVLCCTNVRTYSTRMLHYSTRVLNPSMDWIESPV